MTANSFAGLEGGRARFGCRESWLADDKIVAGEEDFTFIHVSFCDKDEVCVSRLGARVAILSKQSLAANVIAS